MMLVRLARFQTSQSGRRTKTHRLLIVLKQDPSRRVPSHCDLSPTAAPPLDFRDAVTHPVSPRQRRRRSTFVSQAHLSGSDTAECSTERSCDPAATRDPLNTLRNSPDIFGLSSRIVDSGRVDTAAQLEVRRIRTGSDTVRRNPRGDYRVV